MHKARCDCKRCRRPAWGAAVAGIADEPSRFLRRPYFTTTLEGLKALLIAESPIAFRRRLIFTEAEPLHRARMPADLPLS
jgi:hypothetical protein